MSSADASASRRLVVLYGIGGLSDVGRHAILAALEEPTVQSVTVITEYPDMLDDKNWECGCVGGHSNPAKDHPYKIQVIPVNNTWKTPQSNLSQHFEGADAVISCLGHRQPGWANKDLKRKGLIAHDGNLQVIHAMQEAKVDRAVVISSIGIEEDAPPMEFHWAGKIMGLMFKTNSKKAFKDLTAMEKAYKETSLDYLFVRPVGISEEVVPVGKYFLQQEKFKDAVGFNMAKMDVARFMVKEALNPTMHKRGVVIGAEPPAASKKAQK